MHHRIFVQNVSKLNDNNQFIDEIPDCSDWDGDDTKCTMTMDKATALSSHSNAVSDCRNKGGRLPKLTSPEEISATFNFNQKSFGMGDNWISLTSDADR